MKLTIAHLRTGAVVLLAGLLLAGCDQKSGFRQLVGNIGDSENMASINLHLAAGFQVKGTMHSVGFKHGRWLDTVFMQRALGDGNQTLPAQES